MYKTSESSVVFLNVVGDIIIGFTFYLYTSTIVLESTALTFKKILCTISYFKT